MFSHLNQTRQTTCCIRVIDRHQVLRTNTQFNLVTHFCTARINTSDYDIASGQLDLTLVFTDFDELTFQEVHLRRTDEAGNKLVGRVVVQIQRGTVLLQVGLSRILKRTQNYDLVGQGHSFNLVVSYVDNGGVQFLVQLGNLDTHLDAQRSIQV